MKKDDLPFLIRSIDREMPQHSTSSFKIPYSYKQFPKNLMNESHTVQNKFLNNHLHEIDEAKYAKILPKELLHWFLYQNLNYHKKSGILNHDGFFKIQPRIYHNLPFTGTILGFGTIVDTKVNGPDLEVYAGGSGGDTAGALSGSPVSGTIGNFYDRLAVNVQTAAGDERLGVYDGDASNATNLLAETGSIACATGFNWRSVTEFPLVTVVNWICHQSNNASNLVYRTSSVSRLADTLAFGAFPNPLTTETIGTGTGSNMKMGHS